MSTAPKKDNGTKPAVTHSKSILDDRRIRLALAVLGAVIAWMVVTIIVQPGTTNMIYNVPVDYTYDSSAYTSRGLSIVSAEDKTVNLKLSGDGYTIGGLAASDFVVYPDWSSVRDSGEKNLRLLVRGANSLLNGITVTIDGSDNTVDVVFDVVEEKTLPVTTTTNYLTISDGYILYSTEVSKETVTLSGPSSELDKVATCTAEVTYTGELDSSVTLETPLRFYTSGGTEVKFEYTELEESTVDVTLQVYKMATLPVNVTFINAPRGFDNSVLVYALSRQQLKVAGPAEKIDALSTLSIGTIDLSTFSLNKTYEMPIDLPSDIYLLDNISSITVSFDCSNLETKTLNLPSSCVQVVNLPSTYQLTVETDRLMNVILCGPKGAMETLTPEQVVIEIDAEDFSVATGQQNIACRLYVPSNGKIFALGSYVLQCRIDSN
jgi:YbbR domain-containing protein